MNGGEFKKVGSRQFEMMLMTMDLFDWCEGLYFFTIYLKVYGLPFIECRIIRFRILYLYERLEVNKNI